MTIKEIESAIATIKESADNGGHAFAHGREDSLREDFIKYIATGNWDASITAKAKLILTTADIEFARWYE